MDWTDIEAKRQYHRDYARDRKQGVRRRAVKAKASTEDLSRVPYGVPAEFKRFAQVRFK